MLTQERLKEILDYNKETGIFTWKINRLNAKIGNIVKLAKMSTNCSGQIRYVIKIDGINYDAGRLAWLFEHNEFPNLIRHNDGDTKNNKINNLINIIRKGRGYKLTQAELKDLLLYSPYTGAFIWRKNHGSIPAWTIAGYADESGYISIRIYERLYLASRLAWFYTYGEWPSMIDHIDHDKHNDRISNLRDVTGQINSKNCIISKNNTSGFTGVSWSKQHGKWESYIKVDFKKINLGIYDDIIEAVYTRWIAENVFDFHPTHGRVDSRHRQYQIPQTRMLRILSKLL